MSLDRKKEIQGGGFWVVAVGISLIVSAVVQIVQAILSIVQVANQAQASESSDTSTATKSYTPYYSKSSAFVRISKYPSRTTINYGL